MNNTQHIPGTAIYVPVCSPKHCCTGKGKLHHLTLVHLKTRDPIIVNLALSHIRRCIQTNHHLTTSGTRKVVSYKIGKQGPNSTVLTGKVEDFKKSLDSYLRRNQTLANYMSPYRSAHVDRYNRSLRLYPTLSVAVLDTMKA